MVMSAHTCTWPTSNCYSRPLVLSTLHAPQGLITSFTCSWSWHGYKNSTVHQDLAKYTVCSIPNICWYQALNHCAVLWFWLCAVYFNSAFQITSNVLFALITLTCFMTLPLPYLFLQFASAVNKLSCIYIHLQPVLYWQNTSPTLWM